MYIYMHLYLYTVEVRFGYERQPVLFEKLDFGINMESRGECVIHVSSTVHVHVQCSTAYIFSTLNEQ